MKQTPIICYDGHHFQSTRGTLCLKSIREYVFSTPQVRMMTILLIVFVHGHNYQHDATCINNLFTTLLHYATISVSSVSQKYSSLMKKQASWLILYWPSRKDAIVPGCANVYVSEVACGAVSR